MAHQGRVFCFTMVVGLAFAHGDHKGVAWWGPLIGTLEEASSVILSWLSLLMTPWCPKISPKGLADLRILRPTNARTCFSSAREMLYHHNRYRKVSQPQGKHEIQGMGQCDLLIPLSWHASFEAACFEFLRILRRLITGLLRGDGKLLTSSFDLCLPQVNQRSNADLHYAGFELASRQPADSFRFKRRRES